MNISPEGYDRQIRVDDVLRPWGCMKPQGERRTGNFAILTKRESYPESAGRESGQLVKRCAEIGGRTPHVVWPFGSIDSARSTWPKTGH
jgi:hypothetical protein